MSETRTSLFGLLVQMSAFELKVRRSGATLAAVAVELRGATASSRRSGPIAKA